MRQRRSNRPINLTLETFGDRWSLIIMRDKMFSGRRRGFRSLLTESFEGIASDILSDRFKRLTAKGLLSRSEYPHHKQKIVYSLSDKAIELVPLMAEMGSWGIRHATPAKELSARAQVLEDLVRTLERAHGRAKAYSLRRTCAQDVGNPEDAGSL